MNSMEVIDNITEDRLRPATFPLKMLVCNVRGLSNENALNKVRDMINTHRPDIVILMKTRVGKERMTHLAQNLPFDCHVALDNMGRGGGILVM